jgi:superfamily II DNA helicase RecQ
VNLFWAHPYFTPREDEEIQQKNKEAMVRWIAGKPKIMTSTSILGCGIDYHNIRDVIHRDPSFSMLDQYQEDSRGG